MYIFKQPLGVIMLFTIEVKTTKGTFRFKNNIHSFT